MPDLGNDTPDVFSNAHGFNIVAQVPDCIASNMAPASVPRTAIAGLLVGAILMYFPAAIPFSVPLMVPILVVLLIRALVTRRSVTPVLWTGAVSVALLVVVVLHAVYWPDHPGPYVQIASLPLMPVLTLALAVWAGLGRRWALVALLVAQTVVFGVSYLDSFGSLTYAESSTGFDNLLTLTYWACLACAARAWLTPRRTLPQGMGEPAEAVEGAR